MYAAAMAKIHAGNLPAYPMPERHLYNCMMLPAIIPNAEATIFGTMHTVSHFMRNLPGPLAYPAGNLVNLPYAYAPHGNIGGLYSLVGLVAPLNANPETAGQQVRTYFQKYKINYVDSARWIQRANAMYPPNDSALHNILYNTKDASAALESLICDEDAEGPLLIFTNSATLGKNIGELAWNLLVSPQKRQSWNWFFAWLLSTGRKIELCRINPGNEGQWVHATPVNARAVQGGLHNSIIHRLRVDGKRFVIVTPPSVANQGLIQMAGNPRFLTYQANNPGSAPGDFRQWIYTQALARNFTALDGIN